MIKKFINNYYKNIPGVTVINSGNSGKNIGIFAVTHGNEPVGLKIFEYLVEQFNINRNLKKGKIYLISVNIQAYENYIKSGEIHKYRFVDNNMNRISNKEFIKGSYEFKRLEELKPIFDEIDIAIDIHSVPKGNDILGIADKKYLETSKNFFDVEKILVDEIGKTGAIIGYFLRNSKEAYGIECGNHIDNSGFENGKTNILNFLSYFECIDHNINKKNSPEIYEFLEEFFPYSENFEFKYDFKGFTKISTNETFAIDKGKEYKNEFGYDIYLGFPKKEIKVGDGAGYLFKKID